MQQATVFAQYYTGAAAIWTDTTCQSTVDILFYPVSSARLTGTGPDANPRAHYKASASRNNLPWSDWYKVD